MSVLERIAYFQNRRDDIPNQELAMELAELEDRAGIKEIAENLQHKNRRVQGNCIKVLYEIGYLKPELIAPYADDFLQLLQSKNNRLVWGSMIALSTIAQVAPNALYPHYAKIQRAMERGSVITIDAGVKTLALIAAANKEYRQTLLPWLLHHLQTCRPKDVPQHAEKIAIAVDAQNPDEFLAILNARLPELSKTQSRRIKKLIRLFL